jgi:hypothetical protein
MDSIKAVCECRQRNEADLVLAIRKKPTEGWGAFKWLGVGFLLLATGGTLLPFIFGWVMGSYWLHPTYSCQHCGTEIEKHDYRS